MFPSLLSQKDSILFVWRCMSKLNAFCIIVKIITTIRMERYILHKRNSHTVLYLMAGLVRYTLCFRPGPLTSCWTSYNNDDYKYSETSLIRSPMARIKGVL